MNKLQRFGKGLQPFVALIGSNLNEISQTFVYLYEEHRYEVDDPLTAVDLVFKCIHALHTPYASEAAQAWQFIQRVIYEIPYNSTDNQYFPSVETMINDFKNYNMN